MCNFAAILGRGDRITDPILGQEPVPMTYGFFIFRCFIKR